MQYTSRRGTLSPRLGRALLAGFCVLWIGGVSWGMKLLLDYQIAPGTPALAPAVWPAASNVSRRPHQPTLVVLLHPHCPCTRATLGELSRVVARTRGQFAIEVLFVVPKGKPARWARSGLWQSATEIPGAHVMLDPEGIEARRFGAFTSGQVLYYDRDGMLRFSGGITPGRGHGGDNAGADAVVAFASHGDAAWPRTPVFGCELATPEPRRAAPQSVRAP